MVDNTMSLPLDGIKVLDLTRLMVGPFCTMMLGDMGAEIIKVEIPHGEDTRHMGASIKGESALFLSLNRNKKSVTLNLKTPEGKEIFFKLVSQADILVQNFLPGVVERWGITYPAVAEINPKIIYISITGFGEQGPYRDKPSLDLIIQGMAGLMTITGPPGGPPTRVGTSIADIVTGIFSAYGALAALYARERTGMGQKVEISLLDSMISLQTPRISQYFATGLNPARIGSASPFLSPIDTFETKDSYINISVFSDKLWSRFCQKLGIEYLTRDPRFDSNAKRLQHREELTAILQAIFKEKGTAEWINILEEEGIPCGSIDNYGEVFANPQTIKNEMVIELEHPIAGKIKVTGLPVKLQETPGSIRLPPPTLGQHTQEILTQLGYSTAEIDHLKARGVI